MKNIQLYEKKIKELTEKLDFEIMQAPAMIQGFNEWEHYNEEIRKNESIENKIYQYTKLINKAKGIRQ